MNLIRIICRQSKLSLLQADLVKQKLQTVIPGVEVVVQGISSRGDREAMVPLQTLEGKDFFTEDITQRLKIGEADIAVHSLKDLSSEHFFSHKAFAVPDRNDTRDIALFVPDIEEKIKAGNVLQIGTSSPRRETMAVSFLQKALPQLNTPIKIEAKTIRGNVDTRLKKLDAGEYDGIILATAGLNRLLNSTSDGGNVHALLSDKKKMLLPLIECVPAPCQGAIVAEADPNNVEMVTVLKLINDENLFRDCYQEKQTAHQYGSGCFQQFGVTTIHYRQQQSCFAAGYNAQGEFFEDWSNQPVIDLKGKKLFSSTDYMSGFFSYEETILPAAIQQQIIFVANFKVLRTRDIEKLLEKKIIWASGSRTWYELAKKGYWVQGGADAFGLEFLESSFSMPLLKIDKKNVCILTNAKSVNMWKEDGWNAVAAYKLIPVINSEIEEQIKEADAIFWTNYQQYEQYKSILKSSVIHLCPSGKTASLLKAEGIEPVVFATIKSFLWWRKNTSHIN